ncbi:MAG: hypothetical protein Q7R46_01470 [bacterium]|nr:hypothetical protein [bacterium]
MIFSIFLTLIFFFILFFFGWQLARYFLKENRIEYLIGFSGIFGIGLYIFFVNALGHFIPIKTVFYLVLALFFLSGLWLVYFNKSESSRWGVNAKWRKILLVTVLLLVATSGLVRFRFPPVLHGTGWPTAATVAEGNFPIVEIWEPRSILDYHYAPELFSAAIHKITGLPLYLAYDFQVAILVGVLFLLGFCLIKRFLDDNNFKAFIASLLMIYAGTISFLNSIKGIPILYNLYIRHQEISAPFKFVSDAVDTEFSVPVLYNMIGVTWGALVFPLIIAVIYLYFHLIDQEANGPVPRRLRYGGIVLCGLLLAVLSQVGEIYLAFLCLILLIYPFASGFIKNDWRKSRNSLLISFSVLIIALPLAFLQGGVLRSILAVAVSRVFGFTGVDGGWFRVNEAPWVVDYFFDEGLPIFRPEFLMEWGLLLAVLIPALIFLFRRNFQLGFFLGIFIIVFFSIAFFTTTAGWSHIAETFRSFTRQGNMWRFSYPVNLIGGLVAGLFLSHLYLFFKKVWLKRAMLLLIIALMLQGLLFQLWYLTVGYPAFTWNAAAKYYAVPDSFEGKAYYWVKKNTTINNFFFIAEKECNYGTSFTPNYRFVINTGRMAPIYRWHCSYPEDSSFRKIKENCDSSAIKNLKYAYLYVNETWPEGLEEKCLANNNLELKFEAGKGDSPIRIYKVLE